MKCLVFWCSVYDEPKKRSTSTGSHHDTKSPYECTWIDLDGKTKPKPGTKAFSAYVTGGQYRLLQTFKKEESKLELRIVKIEIQAGV
jgi:hypothetical protein